MAKNTHRRKSYKRRFEEALGLRDSGRLEEAVRLLQALAEEQGERPEALLILGGIQLNQRVFSDSFEAFMKLVQQYPASEKSSLGLFHSLWGLGRHDDALAEMRRYLADHESWEYQRLRRDLKVDGVLPAGETRLR